MHNHSTYSSRTFFIKKDSTLPELKFPVNQRIMEKYDITADMLDNCAITFSMIDSEGLYRIANVEAKLIIDEDRDKNPDEVKYTLAYHFKRNDTRKSGRFEGEFVIDFLGDNCGKVKFPLDGRISIIIGDTLTKTDVV